MDTILNFLADNYIYFMIGAGVLIIALIGFIIDGKRKQKKEEITGIPTAAAVNATAPIENVQMPNEQPAANPVQEVKAEEPTLTFEAPAEQAEPESIFEIPSAAENNVIGEPITVQPAVEPAQVNEPVIMGIPKTEVTSTTAVPTEAVPTEVTPVLEPTNKPVAEVPVNEPVSITNTPNPVEIPEIMPIGNEQETFITPATQMPEVKMPTVETTNNDNNTLV